MGKILLRILKCFHTRAKKFEQIHIKKNVSSGGEKSDKFTLKKISNKFAIKKMHILSSFRAFVMIIININILHKLI